MKDLWENSEIGNETWETSFLFEYCIDWRWELPPWTSWNDANNAELDVRQYDTMLIYCVSQITEFYYINKFLVWENNFESWIFLNI